MSVKVSYIHEYYDSSFARELAHLSKKGGVFAAREAAEQMVELIPANACLIPVPSRHGYATQTLELAGHISRILGCRVADVVKGTPRQSLYEAKKCGHAFRSEDFCFSLHGDSGDLPVPVIIDFVFATGMTVASIVKLIPDATVAVLTRDSTATLVDSSHFLFEKKSIFQDDELEQGAPFLR